MTYHYSPRGVCSRKIEIELEGEIIRAVRFQGGCSGNTQGVAALAVGMTAEEYISRCAGIKCGPKSTSCPDQLAQALKAAVPCQRVGVAVLGMEVPHTHIHLVPLQTEGDMDFRKKKLELSQEEFAEIATAIYNEYVKIQ